MSSEKCILGGNHTDRKKVPSGHCLYFHFSEADTEFLRVQYETFDRARSAAPDLPRQESIFRFSFITNLFFFYFFIQSFALSILNSRK